MPVCIGSLGCPSQDHRVAHRNVITSKVKVNSFIPYDMEERQAGDPHFTLRRQQIGAVLKGKFGKINQGLSTVTWQAELKKAPPAEIQFRKPKVMLTKTVVLMPGKMYCLNYAEPA
jgi:hypothetical protein